MKTLPKTRKYIIKDVRALKCSDHIRILIDLENVLNHTEVTIQKKIYSKDLIVRHNAMSLELYLVGMKHQLMSLSYIDNVIDHVTNNIPEEV